MFCLDGLVMSVLNRTVLGLACLGTIKAYRNVIFSCRQFQGYEPVSSQLMMGSENINGARSVARLLDAVSSALATKLAQDDELLRTAATASTNPSVDASTALILQLRSDVSGAVTAEPHAVLTAFDLLMIETKKDCAALAEQITALPERCTATKAQPLLQLICEVGGTLGDGIARHHWINMSEAIKQVAASNSRFGASATAKIDEIATDVDILFKAILQLSPDVHHADIHECNSKDMVGLNLFTKSAADYWTRICVRAEHIEELLEQQVILSALHFWTIDNRKALIPKEHEDTFSWILDPTSIFSAWLSTSETLFWVSGKPGSGKSTALKYIAESPKTRELLATWAGSHRLIIADFYFWSSAANELQKSGQGLLRSLMFQILRQCPELGAVAFLNRSGSPKRWEPTFEELKCGLGRLLAQLPTLEIKLCLFIDGLDEFHGHPEDAIRLLQSMSIGNSSIKICVSSRPWVEFEQAFGRGNYRKLYMHELTKHDMHKYVEDELRRRGTESALLVGKIVEKAEGVFLWAFFVLKSLNEQPGPCQCDFIDKIPGNLEHYLERLICSTAPDQRAASAATFRVAITAVGKLPLRQYSLIHSQFVHPGGANRTENATASPSRDLLSVSEMEVALELLSCGLLRPTRSASQEVEFIHRTVADFLQSEKMMNLFRSWCELAVDEQICSTALIMLKTWPPVLPRDESQLLSTLHAFMSHAYRTPVKAQSLVLSELWNLIEQLQKRQPEEAVMLTVLGPGNYWAYDASLRFTFLYYCMSYGFGQYVYDQLTIHELGFAEPTGALLSGSLSWDPRVRPSVPAAPTKAIEPLLDMGLDCNTPWGDRNLTFWQQLVVSSYSKHLKGTLTTEDRLALELALAHGADPTATVEVFAKGVKAYSAEEIMRII
ncbi:hypothetical protein NLG97_g2126 [Lecanicillium saksenae]|uniref:Uncharacterized protein n=1 Tax=Lecanicillium saksenae TaxID=468837 RepID=A0ACC1R1W0_9HYPO|nr:hypothetical protein NLG97_g2126 [Lecanicillium saksenae]